MCEEVGAGAGVFVLQDFQGRHRAFGGGGVRSPA